MEATRQAGYRLQNRADAAGARSSGPPGLALSAIIAGFAAGLGAFSSVPSSVANFATAECTSVLGGLTEPTDGGAAQPEAEAVRPAGGPGQRAGGTPSQAEHGTVATDGPTHRDLPASVLQAQ